MHIETDFILGLFIWKGLSLCGHDLIFQSTLAKCSLQREGERERADDHIKSGFIFMLPPPEEVSWLTVREMTQTMLPSHMLQYHHQLTEKIFNDPNYIAFTHVAVSPWLTEK